MRDRGIHCPLNRCSIATVPMETGLMPMHWWLIIGAALLALELLLIDAQFYLVFLGLAAMATGFALWAGLPAAGIVVGVSLWFTLVPGRSGAG